MASEFKRTQLKQFAKVEERETPEGRFWRRFKIPVVLKQTAPVTDIDFSPIAPYDYAVTAGSRITIYDGRNNKEKKALSKFKETVYSGRFRHDGRLIVCGGERGVVQTIDVKTKTALRQFRGHEGAVHTTRYSLDGTHVVSAGDDCSLRYWDIPSGESVVNVAGAHSDYIRCSAIGPAGSGIAGVVATGSYDHTVKLWDVRTMGAGGSSSSSGGMRASAEAGAEEADEDEDGEEEESEEEEGEEGDADERIDSDDEDEEEEEEEDAEEDGAGSRASSSSGAAAGGGGGSKAGKSLMTVNHGEPVTAVLLLPGGGTLLTAGGNYCRAWDVVGGGRLVSTFASHQKLITSACLDGSGSRLLTSGLDGLVKVHEVGSYKVTHTTKVPGQALALALPPDNSRLVVGQSDGALHVKQRVIRMGEALLEAKEAGVLRSASYRYFLRGRGSEAAGDDMQGAVIEKKGKKLAKHDFALLQFNHHAALDSVLDGSAHPALVSAVVEELASRQALVSALGGRTEAQLAPLLRFIDRHISNPRYASLCADLTNSLADAYAPVLDRSPALQELFVRLRQRIYREVQVGRDMLKLQGSLDLLMAASSTGAGFGGGEDGGAGEEL